MSASHDERLLGFDVLKRDANSVVGRAIDTKDNSPVLVRRLVRSRRFDSSLRRLLIAEVAYTGQLECARCPRAELSRLEDGEFVLYYDHPRGVELDRILDILERSGRVLTPIAALALISEVLHAATHLHQLPPPPSDGVAAIGHGEIAPRSVLLGLDGLGRLYETRLACTGFRSTMSASAQFCRAPELQIGQRAATPPGDVYGVGALLGLMLFGPTTLLDEAAETPQHAILAAQEHSPDVVPQPLVAALLRALSAAPEDRYASVEDLRTAIKDAVPIELTAWRKAVQGLAALSVLTSAERQLREAPASLFEQYPLIARSIPLFAPPPPSEPCRPLPLPAPEASQVIPLRRWSFAAPENGPAIPLGAVSVPAHAATVSLPAAGLKSSLFDSVKLPSFRAPTPSNPPRSSAPAAATPAPLASSLTSTVPPPQETAHAESTTEPGSRKSPLAPAAPPPKAHAIPRPSIDVPAAAVLMAPPPEPTGPPAVPVEKVEPVVAAAPSPAPSAGSNGVHPIARNDEAAALAAALEALSAAEAAPSEHTRSADLPLVVPAPDAVLLTEDPETKATAAEVVPSPPAAVAAAAPAPQEAPVTPALVQAVPEPAAPAVPPPAQAAQEQPPPVQAAPVQTPPALGSPRARTPTPTRIRRGPVAAPGVRSERDAPIPLLVKRTRSDQAPASPGGETRRTALWIAGIGSLLIVGGILLTLQSGPSQGPQEAQASEASNVQAPIQIPPVRPAAPGTPAQAVPKEPPARATQAPERPRGALSSPPRSAPDPKPKAAPAPALADPRPAAPITSRRTQSHAPRSPIEAAPAAARSATAQAPGRLVVNVLPWGHVFVDERAAGYPPVVIENLAPGAHRVRVEREGFEAVERSVEVLAGQESLVHIRLIRAGSP